MSDSIKEFDVTGFPGWKRLEIGSNRRWRSPGGIEISNSQFVKLRKLHADGVIPESELVSTGSTVMTSLRSAASAAKSFIADVSTPAPQVVQTTDRPNIGKTQPPNAHPAPHPQPTIPTDEDVVTEFSLPEPKVHAQRGRPTGNKATEKELADGIYVSLAIITSVIALLIQVPEAAMTDQEAKTISIPAANLLAKSKLNERFGRLIAGSGDWQMLGYALYLYGQRVVTAMSMRGGGGGTQYRPQPQPSPAPAPSSNGHSPVQGASMPYRFQGPVDLRGIGGN